MSAALVVTIALALGGAVMLWVLSTSLTRSAQSNLTARATDLTQLVADQDQEEVQSTLREARRGAEVVQVVSHQGSVVATTDRRVTQPLSTLRPLPGHSAREEVPPMAVLGDADTYLVAARGVTVNDQSLVVLVAVPVHVQTEVRTMALLLIAAIPLVVGLVSLAVWVLVGRSLTSVDRIRQQVAEIDARRLRTRVNVPGSADEIAALAITMNQMLDKLEASDRLQRAFFSDASHELRSPLSTLVTTAEVAALDPTGRTWVALQGTVIAETLRMRALVEDLLTLAKVDSQSLGLGCEDVDVEDVLGAELSRLRALTSLTIRTSLQPARVVGDERRLTQVFRNLLDNAVRHSHSTITLRIEPAQASVVVLVENDGDQISPEDRERIFDRFVRLDDSRSRDGGGSGLGLAIAREIVTAHRGVVDVVAGPSGRTTFRVVLPAADDTTSRA